MPNLPRSHSLVVFDQNGFLLPIQPVTPPSSKARRLIHRSPVLLLIGGGLFLSTVYASSLVSIVLHRLGLDHRGLYAVSLAGTAIVLASYVILVRLVERRPRIDKLELRTAGLEATIFCLGGICLYVFTAIAILGLGAGRFLGL